MGRDLFVGNPYMHTFFRFVAAFLIAPVLILKGIQLNDKIIWAIGLITLCTDAFTFFLSVKTIKEKK
jgi:hypothetical protein